jgi:small subunit ribosomal protein S17
MIKRLIGVVTSNKMNKTIVVKVDYTARHNDYRKYIKQHTTYYVHDEDNIAQIGDKVHIVSCRPLSKLKRWIMEKK